MPQAPPTRSRTTRQNAARGRAAAARSPADPSSLSLVPLWVWVF